MATPFSKRNGPEARARVCSYLRNAITNALIDNAGLIKKLRELGEDLSGDLGTAV